MMNVTSNTTIAASILTNTTSRDEEPHFLFMPVLFFVITQIMILVLSVIGNAIVILIVVKKRRMQSFTNWLILNLAVADIYTVLICIPLEIPIDLGQKWPYKSFFCRIYYPMQTLSIYASVFTLVTLSLSRYWAVVHPFRRQPTVKTAKILIPIIWVCSLIVVIPYIMVLKYNPDEEDCAEVWKDQERRRYTLAIFIFQYILPLCLICVSYSYIIYDLSFRTVQNGLAKDLQKRTETKKVVKLLIIVTVTFALSILPYHGIALLIEFGNASELPYIKDIYALSYLLLYFNAVLNPIIYNVFNSNFRQAFKELYITIKVYVCGRKDTLAGANFFSSRRASMFPSTISKSSRVDDTNGSDESTSLRRNTHLSPNYLPSEYVHKKPRGLRSVSGTTRLMNDSSQDLRNNNLYL